MPNFAMALMLVTASAAIHALWNVLVKKSGATGPMFVWTYSLVAMPFAVTALIVEVFKVGLGAWTWAALVSMVAHTAYAVMLQRAYAGSDMSIVYPISRGLAPAFVAIGAVLVSANLSWPQSLAVCLVLVGACVASGAKLKGLLRSKGLFDGALVAALSAAYTAWDAYAVAELHVPVIAYISLSSLAQFGLLSAMLWGRRSELLPTLGNKWRFSVPIAVLVPSSYILILVAMHYGSASMVATARCLNIVFGTVLGVTMLRERVSARQLTGIAAITLGAFLSVG